MMKTKSAMHDPGSLTLQMDTSIPAIFVFLGDPSKVKFKRSIRVFPGVIINLDTQGRLAAVEFIGPVNLDRVVTHLAEAYDAPELIQLETRRHVIEEVLSSPVQ